MLDHFAIRVETMKRKLRALIPAHNERGQSLVELAISLTVMLLLLAGAVTFGMALFSYVAIRDAAQEGALFGSFNPYLDDTPADGKIEAAEVPHVNGDAICARVKAASTSPVDMSGFVCHTSADGQPINDTAHNTIDVWTTVGKACEGTTTVAGVDTPNAVQVRVEYNYPIIMPYVGGIVGSQIIHLDAVVTDTILEPACP
jgi:Flp pilus assembly protein TadG